MVYPLNHYILILENTYTKQTIALDVFNVSGNTSMYRFDDVVLPDEFPTGIYNWYLVYDLLEYKIDFGPDIMESIVTVVPELNDESELDKLETEIPLKKLVSDFGILEYIKGETTNYQFMNTKQNYHSL